MTTSPRLSWRFSAFFVRRARRSPPAAAAASPATPSRRSTARRSPRRDSTTGWDHREVARPAGARQRAPSCPIRPTSRTASADKQQDAAEARQGPAEADRRAAQGAVQAAVRAAATRSMQLADPIAVDRGRGQGAGRQGLRRRGPEQLRADRRSSRFPKEEGLPEVPQAVGHDARTTCSRGQAPTRCRRSSATKITKGKDKVTDAQITPTTTRTRRSSRSPSGATCASS